MFYNTNKSVFARMQVELGRPPKDVIAIADDRDSAVAAAESIKQEIENYDHVSSGKMLDSITPTVRDGEHVVTAVSYAKFVNGYDKEAGEGGFIEDGVNQAQLDGYDVEATV